MCLILNAYNLELPVVLIVWHSQPGILLRSKLELGDKKMHVLVSCASLQVGLSQTIPDLTAKVM